MCGSSLEASTMPRSFLVKKNQNYSHCPLKKRPLSYFLQESLEAESVTGRQSLFHSDFMLFCRRSKRDELPVSFFYTKRTFD